MDKVGSGSRGKGSWEGSYGPMKSNAKALIVDRLLQEDTEVNVSFPQFHQQSFHPHCTAIISFLLVPLI
jgi:hypothetical protein